MAQGNENWKTNSIKSYNRDNKSEVDSNMNLLYRVLQWTWGLPQTLVGAVFYLINKRNPHFSYHGSCATVWKSKSSLSLGMFVFVSEDPFYYYEDQRTRFTEDAFLEMLLVHEYGHTIQSLIFGPLYLLMVGVPSLLWSYLPRFVNLRERDHISYFSAYPERWANRLGEAVTNDVSIGEPI